MAVEFLPYVLVVLSATTSVLLALVVWNIKIFLVSFKEHVEKDDKFAAGMLTITATIIECNRQIDQRLHRIEQKLWN